MIKKSLLFLCLLFFFPAQGHAWTIAAKIGNPSGSITGGSPDVVTVTSGTGYLTVPAGDATVTITPDPGFSVSLVTLDGAAQTIAPSGGVIPVPHAGKLSRSLIAYFTAATYTMTVTQAPGGTTWIQRILPTEGSNSQSSIGSLRPGAVVRVTAAPNSDHTVTSILVDGSSVWSGSSAATQTYDYTVGSTSPTVSATYLSTPTVTARISVSTVSGYVNGALTLDASSSTSNDAPLSYRFHVISGDAAKVSFTPASPGSNPIATFQATAPGSYKVQVTVTSARGAVSSAATPAITVMSLSDYGSGVCVSCHGNRNPAIVNSFQLSTHNLSTAIDCSSCHNPDNNVPHPHVAQPTGVCLPCHATVTPDAVTQYLASPHNSRATCTGCHRDHSAQAGFNVCGSCHATLYGANAIHYDGATLLSGLCQGCHLQHSFVPVASRAHFSGYTSPSNPKFGAAYLTPATRCANCHLTANGTPDPASDSALLQARSGWAASGHGDTKGRGWIGADFKTLSGCVQCHSSAGFIAYSTAKVTSAWGAASDQTRSVLSCDGCHSNIGTGALRASAPVQPYANDSYLSPDLSSSNLCLKCHSGTQSGRAIKAQAAANAVFSNLAFIGSHASAAAGILFKSGGYQFAFKNYSNNWHFKHDRIGNNNFKAYGYHTGSAGPCVVCHMSSANKHSFRPVAQDASGVITSIASSSCAGCHSGGAYLDAGRMNARRAKFAALLLALQKVLETRGIYYADTAPYFFRSAGNTASGNAVTDWGNADTMGAAFNFHLLQHERGAYVHNMIYSKRLIYDSIDFLDNGLLDSSAPGAINALATLSGTQKATAVGYLAPSGIRP